MQHSKQLILKNKSHFRLDFFNEKTAVFLDLKGCIDQAIFVKAVTTL